MIVQPFVGLFILIVASICGVTGVSYSHVFVESAVAPRGYYTYGAPYQSIANPRLSEINSLPSVPGYVAPCVSPCIYPAQTVATVATANPNQNVLTYNAPNVPIVVAPTKQDATGYEYSYVVYDENTGDHKAQRELSDGSVVRGEYSFLQPDGFVRQVQYVADDISGFNAVVKQYLPTAVEGQKKVEGQGNKESSPPCHEIKNESLKEESEDDSGEISIKKLIKIHGKQHNKHSSEESTEKSKDTSKESGEEENSKEKHTKVSKEESGEDSEAESQENQSKKPNHSKEASEEESEDKSNEKPRIQPQHSKEESGADSEEKSKEKYDNKSKPVSSKESGEESEENSQEETLHKKSKESSGESKEKYPKKESKESGEESVEETDSEESKEELTEKSQKESGDSREKNKKNSKQVSKESSNEESGEESEEVGNGKHKEVYVLLKPNQEVHSLVKPNQEAVVPYNDIIRCIEAAMRRNYGAPAAMRQEPSPLTYIVLNKPC